MKMTCGKTVRHFDCFVMACQKTCTCQVDSDCVVDCRCSRATCVCHPWLHSRRLTNGAAVRLFTKFSC